jgi:eukaryotic-like serine/threonine-protein kinase
MTDVGDRNIGRYVLFDEIAAGGMATVHLGKLKGPVGFSRTVAIKRLHPEYARDPQFVSMFLDEARLASRVRHPNVVPTLDVVTTEQQLFLVMEYVQGASLAMLLDTISKYGERVPPRIVASIVSGALMGLHAAHEARDEDGQNLGIVHRDVSPSNVLVGADGLPRVLDFGVAKAAGRMHNTRGNVLKGTLGYIAPEQFNKEGIDRRADVYSASVMLWEALTGQPLFVGETEYAVIAQALFGEVKPPSSVEPSLAPFDAVVLKGLDREPDNRFSTARQMALAVERCVGTASSAEVAEWLDQVAGNTLRERASILAAVEAGKGRRVSEIRAAMLTALDLPDDPVDENEVGGSTDHTAASPAKPLRKNKGRTHLLTALVAIVGAAAIALVYFDRQRTAAARDATPIEEPAGEPAPLSEDPVKAAVSKPEPPPPSSLPTAEVTIPSAEPSASAPPSASYRPGPRSWPRPSSEPKTTPPKPQPPPAPSGRWGNPDRFGH